MENTIITTTCKRCDKEITTFTNASESYQKYGKICADCLLPSEITELIKLKLKEVTPTQDIRKNELFGKEEEYFIREFLKQYDEDIKVMIRRRIKNSAKKASQNWYEDNKNDPDIETAFDETAWFFFNNR